jgi:hypothetical protein
MLSARNHIWVPLAVLVLAIGALAADLHDRELGGGKSFACQLLSPAAQSQPVGTGPVLTDRKCVPTCIKVEFHPDPPRLADQLQYYQEFEILPSPSCATGPIRCVYVRYWPRDPPSA